MSKLTKLILLPVSLTLGLAGCMGIGPNKTYVLTTTSFNYDPSYRTYEVRVNGEEVGGAFGAGTKRSAVILGPQIITWGEDNSKRKHKATNSVNLAKEDLKNKRYLAVHLYPDDSVEITTSNDLPDPTQKGLDWRDKLRKQSKNK
ncbi:hypothetical protein HYG93_16805 [Acinetobacter sp. SwsAc6]|uniref:hypothetical protein n=1 Tax=Acinetobacter TaxID=469 RepID=UPI000D132D1D|nr:MULTISPECIES: hypothetical protein [Acinetobacter]NWK75888.1 hypothetical protein [Acinetobacter sp. SwsAc6]QCO22593.1 hypothetical protein C9E88_014390 [Acinetobacter cumulans]RKG47063.1 hypothetical protein D7V68_13140 [Acinetobacter cumulans]